MRIDIEYCVQWNYLPRAAGLADELKKAFSAEVQLTQSGGGVFEVTVDGDLVFSKKALGRFPESDEVARRIRDRWRVLIPPCEVCEACEAYPEMNLLDRTVAATLPIVPKPIVRFFSKRYIAGSTIDDAFAVVRDLANQGCMATLDILGEFITTTEQAVTNTDEYVELVERIGQDHLLDTHVSVKLTALGLLIDQQACLENLRRLMRQIEKHDNFLRIDMEDSPCTTATLSIYETLRREFGQRVGVVLQSRLRRTLDDVDHLTTEPTNFRLCKGIYLEPRQIAYTDPELIRRNFMEALDRMFARGAYVGIATHDERLVWEGLRFVRKHGLSRGQYEFQMLLGVDEELRRILIDSGHRVRVYVPYGEQWYAYSVRRLRENPQIAGYALKAIVQRS